jgi:hypothetical protein
MDDPADLWRFLPWGYALSVALETPVLLVGLSPRHSLGRRILCGFWLTACTYPIVGLVLPILVRGPLGETAYLAIAETFAPLAECLLFWVAYDAFTAGTQEEPPMTRGELARDMLAIVAANLTSFVVGWWLLVLWQKFAA